MSTPITIGTEVYVCPRYYSTYRTTVTGETRTSWIVDGVKYAKDTLLQRGVDPPGKIMAVPDYEAAIELARWMRANEYTFISYLRSDPARLRALAESMGWKTVTDL